MSTDLKHDSSANLFPTYENSSTEISLEHPTSPSSSTKHTRSESQSPKPIVVERPISPQQRQRDRHVYDYHRKLLLNYIPILEQNLRIVERLANVKGVYDRKQMEKDFIRHQQILKQDTVNRQKARQTADKQRPFVLPKINVKS